MTFIERFADPAICATMGVGERCLGALMTMAMGMGTTFVVLLLLWAIIALLARITQPKGIAAAGASLPVTPVATIASSAIETKAKDDEDDLELIAVITAAIAVNTGKAADTFRVSRIRRTGSGFTPWSGAGSSECLDSRRI